MISVRPSEQRGHTKFDWLDSKHTFSFADYSDPEHVHFRDLRVINDDRIEPATGFGTHPHRDMEIITYVLDGKLAHRDSLGTGSVLGTGEVQVMSAGTGITHSEFNGSKADPAHFLQIWVLPERKGITPRYEQRAYPENARRGRLQAVASPDGRDGSLKIHQDVTLLLGSLEEGSTLSHPLSADRHAWVQVARGAVDLNGVALKEGDGAAISNEKAVTLRATEDSEVLLFDLR